MSLHSDISLSLGTLLALYFSNTTTVMCLCTAFHGRQKRNEHQLHATPSNLPASHHRQCVAMCYSKCKTSVFLNMCLGSTVDFNRLHTGTIYIVSLKFLLSRRPYTYSPRQDLRVGPSMISANEGRPHLLSLHHCVHRRLSTNKYRLFLSF